MKSPTEISKNVGPLGPRFDFLTFLEGDTMVDSCDPCYFLPRCFSLFACKIDKQPVVDRLRQLWFNILIVARTGNFSQIQEDYHYWKVRVEMRNSKLNRNRGKHAHYSYAKFWKVLSSPPDKVGECMPWKFNKVCYGILTSINSLIRHS